MTYSVSSGTLNSTVPLSDTAVPTSMKLGAYILRVGDKTSRK